jgi:hypothetical protein
VWLAAARRFFTLLGAIVAAIFLCALSIGLILGTSLNRSIAVAFEAFGCLLLLFAFFVGNRGPVRTKTDAHPFIGPRFLRWATPEEHHSTIAESAIFLVLGIVLILIGLAIDSRYRLV